MHSIHAKQAKNLWEQTKGLLGTNKPYPLLFHTRWGIHTLGMKYPIDIVILDKNNTIVKLKENLKPNQIFLWNPKYTNVLELPEGTIQKMKLTLQTQLNVQTD